MVRTSAYGWGRNDDNRAGQFSSSQENVAEPKLIETISTDLSPIQIITTSNCGIVLTAEGKILSYGACHKGELGRGMATGSAEKPAPIHCNQCFTKLSCGYYHCAGLTAQGKIYVWGCSYGSNSEIFSTPTLVEPVDPSIVFCSIALGDEFLMALDTNNNVFLSGTALGYIENTTVSQPTQLEEQPEPIVKIAAGTAFALMLGESGKLYGMGNNGDKQLGFEGGNKNHPSLIPASEKWIAKGLYIKQISCGSLFAAVLLSDGSMYAWGSNSEAQLGLGKRGGTYDEPQKITLPNNDSAITAIATGWYHCLALTADNHIYTWGWNDYCQCGGTSPKYVPTLLDTSSIDYNIVGISASVNQSFLFVAHSKGWPFQINTIKAYADVCVTFQQ